VRFEQEARLLEELGVDEAGRLMVGQHKRPTHHWAVVFTARRRRKSQWTTKANRSGWLVHLPIDNLQSVI